MFVHKLKSSALSIAALSLITVNCNPKRHTSKANDDEKNHLNLVEDDASVQDHWQDWFLAKLSSIKSEESVNAFGLFSTGGFAGSGNDQLILYVTKNSSELYRLELGHEEPNLSLISQDKLSGFLSKSEGFDNLPKLDIVAFDNFRYEYVHAAKSQENISIIARVKIDDPYLDKEKNKPYIDLFKSFHNLLD